MCSAHGCFISMFFFIPFLVLVFYLFEEKEEKEKRKKKRNCAEDDRMGERGDWRPETGASFVHESRLRGGWRRGLRSLGE